MPSKGRFQKNMAEHGSAEGGSRHPQSQGLADVDGEHGSTEPSQENVNSGGTKRAKWSHQAKLCLIELLRDYDVLGFRTNNSWSKEAWNNIVSRLNAKLGTSDTLYQAKQKEQDLKKDFRVVKDLVDQSGFGWDNERNMVHAPENVWASFAARKENEAALSWRTKSFPYYNDLFKLYVGRYAEGRTRHGMDHYASKSKNASVPSAEAASVPDTPSPILNGLDESALQFPFDEELEEGNLEFSQRPASSHVHQMEISCMNSNHLCMAKVE
ncbi:hypothetical protein EJB05_49017 [Eragrostis curvula]|uniref:Myb/SANT-like domain-containing protein n=1 Tax=Eragrostis curvula TaxID=38414 RepID=A0A5J9T379_9POAL|nr:hypothetical protein EJB05_49017 [Eragrostis curvula]